MNKINQKKMMSLVARVLGTTLFSGLLLFNVVYFIKKDSATGNFTLDRLQAIADDSSGESTGGGSDSGKKLKFVSIKCFEIRDGKVVFTGETGNDCSSGSEACTPQPVNCFD